MILDGTACRLGEHGDVHDVLGVLGVDRVVPIAVRVLVSWWTAGERATKGETCAEQMTGLFQAHKGCHCNS